MAPLPGLLVPLLSCDEAMPSPGPAQRPRLQQNSQAQLQVTPAGSMECFASLVQGVSPMPPPTDGLWPGPEDRLWLGAHSVASSERVECCRAGQQAGKPGWVWSPCSVQVASKGAARLVWVTLLHLFGMQSVLRHGRPQFAEA